ncbi:hypothetical protein DFQ27_000123 [Actinomortierella ambigua]|uniref:Uncharacterized protein n=1 Tax=Actinomortierella ambigua TaxID=1343610 RepID=A0A9P6QDF1_9FUNG|nr:hypothetical protein DFQ27_000123 [Actinomortierella ambigua]
MTLEQRYGTVTPTLSSTNGKWMDIETELFQAWQMVRDEAQNYAKIDGDVDLQPPETRILLDQARNPFVRPSYLPLGM